MSCDVNRSLRFYTTNVCMYICIGNIHTFIVKINILNTNLIVAYVCIICVHYINLLEYQINQYQPHRTKEYAASMCFWLTISHVRSNTNEQTFTKITFNSRCKTICDKSFPIGYTDVYSHQARQCFHNPMLRKKKEIKNQIASLAIIFHSLTERSFIE